MSCAGEKTEFCCRPTMQTLTSFFQLFQGVPLPRQKSHWSDQILRGKSVRIINGTETTIEENPHQISLQLKDYGHWCGGSIISVNWVVTAAHCVHGKEAAEFMILAGTANQFEGGSRHLIKEMIIYTEFKPVKKSNDIALLRVDESFVLDATRKPIPLYSANEETKAGSVGVVSGWGETGNGFPDILNRVELPIMSKNRCSQLYESLGGLDEGQICAAYEEGGKDACHGDSGGPLTVNGRLAGVVSWGAGCAKPKRPGVYTEISYFREWIRGQSGV